MTGPTAGRGEDKAAKNMFAREHVTHSMGPMKTVGVMARDDIEDVIEVAEPVGAVCAITPVTNPTSTTVFGDGVQSMRPR